MKIKLIEAESITFDNDTVLMSYHCLDCCERHYLDMQMLKDCNVATSTGETINIYDMEFDFENGVPFKRIENEGILLYDANGNKYFIAGYGYNNGYYSTDIDLIYCTDEGDIIYEYDVSECQEID